VRRSVRAPLGLSAPAVGAQSAQTLAPAGGARNGQVCSPEMPRLRKDTMRNDTIDTYIPTGDPRIDEFGYIEPGSTVDHYFFSVTYCDPGDLRGDDAGEVAAW
jgi:hypothetical protein